MEATEEAEVPGLEPVIPEAMAALLYKPQRQQQLSTTEPLLAAVVVAVAEEELPRPGTIATAVAAAAAVPESLAAVVVVAFPATSTLVPLAEAAHSLPVLVEPLALTVLDSAVAVLAEMAEPWDRPVQPEAAPSIQPEMLGGSQPEAPVEQQVLRP